MEQKIAIIQENTINVILEQQQKILQLLQGKGENMESSIFCSVREAAQILGVSEQKIRRMVDNDEVQYRKIGRAIRIHKSSLI